MNADIINKLQAISIETLTNVKTLQNVIKAVEWLSNSPDPKLRQYALTVQHKLDSNKTYQEMKKVEEIKAESQQTAQAEEKRLEQAQHRQHIATELRAEKKKEEAKKEEVKWQQAKELLSSSSFTKLPLWQQLDVIDDVVKNFPQLDNTSQLKVVSVLNEGFNSEDPAIRKQVKKQTNELIANDSNQHVDIAKVDPKLTQQKQQLAEKAQVEALQDKDAGAFVNATNYGYQQALIEAACESGKLTNFQIIFDENGQPFLAKKDGVEISPAEMQMAHETFDEITTQLGYSVINKERAKEVFEKIHQFEEEQRKLLIEENKITNKHLAKAGISTLLANVITFSKEMTKEGLFKEDNAELMKFGMKTLFSNVIEQNPTLKYTLHTMTKEFMKGESDALLTVPLFKEILAKENGEQILQEFFRQQTWLGNHPQIIVDKIKQAVQDPHYEQRVQQAETESKQISLDDWNQKIVKEREQDALLNVFGKLAPEEYERLGGRFEVMKLSNDEIKQHLEKFGDQFTAEFEKEMALRGDYQRHIEEKDRSAVRGSENEKDDKSFSSLDMIADAKELSERAENYPNYCKKDNLSLDNEQQEIAQTNTHKQNA